VLSLNALCNPHSRPRDVQEFRKAPGNFLKQIAEASLCDFSGHPDPSGGTADYTQYYRPDASNQETQMRNVLSLALAPIAPMFVAALSLRKSVVILTVLIAAGFISSGASARTVSISVRQSLGDIQIKCTDAGGSFFNTAGGGYGCSKIGTVTCDKNGKCQGWVPGRTVPPGSIVGTIQPGGRPVVQGGKENSTGKTGLGPVRVTPTGGLKQTGGNTGNVNDSTERSGNTGSSPGKRH
jgi:hypothetical protein